jgi:hypothetical protein
MSRCGVIGIATAYGLDDRGVRVRVPIGSRIQLLHIVETGSGIHPTSYPMVTGGIAPGCEADHSPLTSAVVKKT